MMKKWLTSAIKALETSTQVSNLIRDALDAGRIKRKDPTSVSSKFAEYIPCWA